MLKRSGHGHDGGITWVGATQGVKLALLLFLAISAHTKATGERRVRWYVNTDAEANVAFAQNNPNSLTGWYGCCGLFRVNKTGGVSSKTNLQATVQKMKSALDHINLTFHAIFSVDESAIHSGVALNGVEDLVASAKTAGVDGLICDYEPSDNYTTAHAESYATFLRALATRLHDEDMDCGMDVAGWGILDLWNVYGPLNLDVYTSMSPTYSAKNISQDEAFASTLVQAVGEYRAAIGVGSVPQEGYEQHCQNMPSYLWDNATFSDFLSWLGGSAGVLDVDVWRCDIDDYGMTATWFVEALAGFLEGSMQWTRREPHSGLRAKVPIYSYE